MDNLEEPQPVSRKPTLNLKLLSSKKKKTEQESPGLLSEPAFQPNRPVSMVESPTKAAMKLLDKSKMSLGEFINLLSECDLNASRLSKKLTDMRLNSIIDDVQVAFPFREFGMPNRE